MADGRTAWVKARITLPWADPGKIGQTDADGGEAFIIESVCHLNRLKALRQFQLSMNAVHIVGRQGQQLRQRLDGLFFIGEPVGDDVYPKIRTIGCDGFAITVNEPTATGRDDGEVDPIAFGKQLIFLVIGHGDIGHTRGHGQADRCLHAAYKSGTAGEREIKLS